MEIDLEEQNAIPFVGIDTTKRGNRVETSVHRKSTNTGLLFHYQSQMGNGTNIVYFILWSKYRAHGLSSTPAAFS